MPTNGYPSSKQTLITLAWLSRAALPASIIACAPAAHDATHAPTPTGRAALARAQGESPAPAALRYAIPSCPLTYEVSTEERTQTKGAEGMGGGAKAFMTIEARPSSPIVELSAVVKMFLATGRYRPYAIEATTFAPVRLKPEGASLAEVDGPTALWGSLGTQGGLSCFFPTLPAAVAGTSTPWEITRPGGLAVMRTEAARGTVPGRQALVASFAGQPDDPSKRIRLGTVRFDRWSDAAGARVAHFVVAGAEHEATDDMANGSGPSTLKVGVVSDVKYAGTVEVTERGWLLRSTLEKTAHIVIGSGEGHDQTALLRMNLVKACEGPTAPSLKVPLGYEERAIVAYGDARVALATGKREKFLDAFAPAVRMKHGDDKLWKSMTKYAQRRGVQALGMPELLRDDAVARTGASVGLNLDASTRLDKKGEPAHSIGNVVVALTEVDGKFVIESLRVEELSDDKHPRLLEVSDRTLYVNDRWPEK